DKINHLILMVQGSKNVLSDANQNTVFALKDTLQPETSKKKDKLSSDVILESQFESNQQDSNLENTKPAELSSRKFDTSTEIKKKFLGTEVDPNQTPKLDS
ncbi:DNA polymerase III subunit gamma/tau, partial [Leptospira borgpetersenii serovar Hardjo-bovis]|nr:DNA polymerase III subunit gamma/tau [Leptospira borgpetersenii serovar Hardjo-bovis]